MGVYGVVYRATNKINGKSYIGITTQDFEKYKSKHIRLANKISMKYKVFHSAIRKYGQCNFEWSILEHCQDKLNLCDREIFYIDKYRTYLGFSDCNGYNMTLGGELYSYKLSDHPNQDEIRKRLSSIRSGKTYEEIYGIEQAAILKESRKAQLKIRPVSDIVKETAKDINKKCFLIINIYTKKFEYVYKREDIEQICGDSFYRVQKFRTDWALLEIVKYTDENYKKMVGYTESVVYDLLDKFLATHEICKTHRRKRTTPNSTKGKTYEEIYGIEETKKRKENWNGRRKINE